MRLYFSTQLSWLALLLLGHGGLLLSQQGIMRVMRRSAAGPGTYTFVDSQNGGSSANNSAATTAALNCTGANFGVMAVVSGLNTGGSHPTPSTIGDSVGNSYSLVGSQTNDGATKLWWYIATSFTPSSSMTMHATSDFPNITSFCFNFSSGTPAFDTSNLSNTCYACAIPSTTPAGSDELALLAGSTEGSGVSLSAPTGYSAFVGSAVSTGNGYGIWAGYKIKTGSSSAEAPVLTTSTTGTASLILMK